MLREEVSAQALVGLQGRMQLGRRLRSRAALHPGNSRSLKADAISGQSPEQLAVETQAQRLRYAAHYHHLSNRPQGPPLLFRLKAIKYPTSSKTKWVLRVQNQEAEALVLGHPERQKRGRRIGVPSQGEKSRKRDTWALPRESDGLTEPPKGSCSSRKQR